MCTTRLLNEATADVSEFALLNEATQVLWYLSINAEPACDCVSEKISSPHTLLNEFSFYNRTLEVDSTMNFSLRAFAIGIGAAIGAAITLNTSPAQAISLGSTLNFGFGGAVVDGTIIDARNSPAPSPGVPGPGASFATSDGDFAILPPFSPIIVSDLNLLLSGTPQFFLDLAINDFDFTVNSITQIGTGLFKVAGVFGDGTPGSGELSTQFGASFSGGITAVPSPALIPAVLGMGVAALRKRKREEDAAEANQTDA